MKKKHEEQIEEIEKLVRFDLANGRHVQKKVKKKISDQGLCQDTVCEELEKIKLAVG